MSKASSELDFGNVIPPEQPTSLTVSDSPPDDHAPVKLTASHEKVRAYMLAKGATWDEKHKRLTTHTCHLAACHRDVKLKGVFRTISEGTEPQTPNCFAYPTSGGAWNIYRFTKGTKEAETWSTSKNGWTFCYLNKVARKAAPKPADLLYDDAIENDKLYHDGRISYVQVDNKFIPVLSIEYEQILRLRYWTNHHSVPKRDWLSNAVAQLDAYAIHEGEPTKVYTRVAFADDALWINLGNEKGDILRIDRDGWKVVPSSPVRFVRSDSMLPLPAPEEGGSLDDLWPFFNVYSADRPLFIAVLLGMYLPYGAFPILSLCGGDGRGKTQFVRRLSGLVDPSTVVGASAPTNERDLILPALQRFLLTFDNLGKLEPWLSDAMCRMSTGAALETRKLYTNNDVVSIVLHFLRNRP